MKIAAVLLCFIFLLGCNKEKDKNGLTELNGNWELRVTDGGYSYEHNTYPYGNGNTLAFSGVNQFKRVTVIDGRSYTDSGTYTVAEAANCHDQNLKFIRFSDLDAAFGLSVSVVGDSLYLKANSCVVSDGVDRTYARID